MKYLFPEPQFQSVFVPRFEAGLIDSIYKGLVFVSIQPIFVLISMIPLPFTLLFWVRVYTPFLCFLSREDPLAFVDELVWWC